MRKEERDAHSALADRNSDPPDHPDHVAALERPGVSVPASAKENLQGGCSLDGVRRLPVLPGACFAAHPLTKTAPLLKLRSHPHVSCPPRPYFEWCSQWASHWFTT